MPSISYFLATTGHPIDEHHPLWGHPLPDARPCNKKKPDRADTGTVTYGDYFSAVSAFCAASGWNRVIKAVSCKLKQPITEKDLGPLSIFLEKHGAFYHPARLQVKVKGRSLAFVVNVATSSYGKNAMRREVKALNQINDQRPFGWFPEVYDCASAALPMFLGDWFDGFHEFHLTRQHDRNEPAIVVWDGASVRRLLSDKQTADLYRNAAMILTGCYDPVTTCQIFPWHHAAGDFVVRVHGEGVTVRLITVRDYVPMSSPDAEPDNERSILDALVVFFIHLSIRMQLDRLDGVSEMAWASDGCLEPTIEGFFKGLYLTARISGFPETFPETFRNYLNHHEEATFLSMARRVSETVFDQQSEERRLIDRHLTRHVRAIRRLLAA